MSKSLSVAICPFLSLALSSTLLGAPGGTAFDLNFGAVDEERAHRRSSFFRPADVKEASVKKRVLLNPRVTGAASQLRFSRPFYRVEETTGAGRRITYYLSDVRSNAQGKIEGYQESSLTKGQRYGFRRSRITYDRLGAVASYHEEGTDTGGVHYRFDRTRMTWRNGRLVAFTERGRRNETQYTLGRTDITYDRQGRMTSYREAGQVSRPGARSTYKLTRTRMQYEGGSLTGYEESGSNDGEPYTYSRKSIKYIGDRMQGYSETGIRNGKHYKVKRSRITYKGDDVVGFQEKDSQD